VPQLIIREFKKQDAEGVIECARLSFADQFEVEGYDPEIWRKIINRRYSISGKTLFFILRLLNREPIKFFVAETDGKPIGTAMVEKRGRIGYIQTVMVHPDFRRKGTATQLMKTAINYIKSRKLNKAILHVLSENYPAKILYQKLGFNTFETIQYLTARVDSLPNTTNPKAVKVRDFRKSDLDPVYDLIRMAREPERLKVYDFNKADLETSTWQRLARIGNSRRTVAEKDNKIVGYATTMYTTTGVAGRITNIEVHPEMVSERIEEQFIQISTDYLKTRGTKTVLVTVPLARDAIIERLTSLGFKKSYAMEGMVLTPLDSKK
jgi:ribosomal protein S18 acetylase RimI-like enzyme